ncbi:DUF4258 domain-containing protein [Blastococcus capsensis]|uniref:DUF4258 domain-containing protein n=1 Tax=Blastococcus capsensis TaxID=1564163 RepID=UPI0025402ECD|nr:DUF4258 domain-containing protein [Blastococcus capsensis]MDK3255076.1 DUF4258 domain-containing protein [Blastococcus capsensis]
MSLRFSGHARRRMAARRIDAAEVEEALAAPDLVHASQEHPDERTVIRGRTSTGRRLKVVVLTDDKEYVVTVADQGSEA